MAALTGEVSVSADGAGLWLADTQAAVVSLGAVGGGGGGLGAVVALGAGHTATHIRRRRHVGVCACWARLLHSQTYHLFSFFLKAPDPIILLSSFQIFLILFHSAIFTIV